MNHTIQIEKLPAVQLAAALASDWANLTSQQISALEEFIVRIGGMENASLAVEMLCQMESPVDEFPVGEY